MLEINQRLELEVKSGEYAGTYLSRVEEIGEQDIKIAIPVEKGSIVPLRLKTPVTVTVQGKDAVYSADTFIVGRLLTPIPILVLLKPKEFRRIQRRDYVRVEANLPVTIELSKNEEEQVVILSRTCNISGGGMMLSLDLDSLEETEFSVDAVLDLNIEIPELEQPIKAIGRIVRCEEKKSPNSGNELCLGLKFTLIEEKDRDQIISYVFKRQRELRKLGLL